MFRCDYILMPCCTFFSHFHVQSLFCLFRSPFFVSPLLILLLLLFLMHLLLSVCHCSECMWICECVHYFSASPRKSSACRQISRWWVHIFWKNEMHFFVHSSHWKNVCCTSNAPTIEIERKFGMKATAASVAVIL